MHELLKKKSQTKTKRTNNKGVIDKEKNMDGIKELNFYLGEKQENIDLVCQFLENVGFGYLYHGDGWKTWGSKCAINNSGCFVTIKLENKSFRLDGSDRKWLDPNNKNPYPSGVRNDIMLVDVLPGRHSEEVKKVRFFLGDKQENINLICQFLENVGYSNINSGDWKNWTDGSLKECYIRIYPKDRKFDLDGSGRKYLHDKFNINTLSDKMIDLLPKVGVYRCPEDIKISVSEPTLKVDLMFCNCASPKTISNSANGEFFKICTVCKKEKK